MLSRPILVSYSPTIVLAIPKSMSLSAPRTHRKLAGLRSPWITRASWIAFTDRSICSQYRQTKFSEIADPAPPLPPPPDSRASSFCRLSMPARSMSPHSITMYTI